MSKLEKTDCILIVSFFILITFPLLYLFRFLDDNTLTSWRWVFLDIRVERIFLLIFLGTILSFLISKISFPERYPSLFLFLLSFSIVLPLWREPEVILDASRYFLQAKYLEIYGIRYFFEEWGKEIVAWTDMPLVPFFYGLTFKFFGEIRGYIQFFNTLLFSLSVVLTYLIGKTLWDKEKGFYAGLLLMGIPYLPIQVPLMLVDVPTMFLLTLAVYTFLKAIEKGGLLWIALASFAIFLTIFAKYSTWLMLSIIIVISCTYQPKGTKITFYRTALIILLIVGLLSGVMFFLKYNLFQEQIALLRTYQWSGLSRWQEGFVSTFLFQTHFLISISALFAIYVAIKNRDRRFLIAGWFAVFVIFLQIERIRYILPLFPLFTLMASYGLNEIKDKEVKRFIGFCIVTSSLAILLGGFFPFLNKTSMANLQNAGKYLDTLNCEAIEIYTLPQRESTGNTEAAIPILDLFTTRRLLYLQEQLFSPGDERIKKSSLRFTWEFKRPGFYSGNGTNRTNPIAIISSEIIDEPPQEIIQNMKSIKILKKFVVSSGVFRYKTFVAVFGGDCLSRTEQ